MLVLVRCFSCTRDATPSDVFLFGCLGYDSVFSCYRLLASATHAQGAAATDTPRLREERDFHCYCQSRSSCRGGRWGDGD